MVMATADGGVDAGLYEIVLLPIMRWFVPREMRVLLMVVAGLPSEIVALAIWTMLSWMV